MRSSRIPAGVSCLVLGLALAAASSPSLSPGDEALGLALSPGEDGARVVTADPKGVAFQAGVRPRDVILEIDGVSVAGASLDQIRAQLAVDRPDPLRLTLRRAGSTQSIRLRRPHGAPPPDFAPPLEDLAGGSAGAPPLLPGPQSPGRLEVIARAAVAVGDPMIDFTLPRIDGGQVTLSKLKGKPIFLDFWATWCAPCRSEAPTLAAIYRRYGDRVHMLGLSLDDDARAPLAYAAQYGLAYPHLLTEGWLDPTVKSYGVQRTGIPFNVLIDSAGKVAALDLHGEPLARAIEALIRPVPQAR